MELTKAQIAEFDECGYLLFSELLDSEEVSLLQREVTDLMARTGPEVVREKEPSSAIRLVFGGHNFSKPSDSSPACRGSCFRSASS